MQINYDDLIVHDMKDGKIDVMSTSMVTADASPIILAETETLRLRFVPQLVDNGNDREKSVGGRLVYERKKKNDPTFPSNSIEKPEKLSRQSFKSGEWTEIRLDTTETYNLFNGLKDLYKLYGDIGSTPVGKATYQKVDNEFGRLLNILKNNPSALQVIEQEENHEFISVIINLITQIESSNSLKDVLSKLQDGNLNNLSAALNIEKLQRVADLMQTELNNDQESFWQDIFQENQWILAQIFASPCTIFRDKAYVGGKGVDNSGGNLCDFIYQNKLSKNVALVEIKTPCTKIIGGAYRQTFSFTQELSGAINQVLNYKDNLMKEYYSIVHKGDSFEAFSPKCVVIIGNLKDMTDEQIAAFENYRNSLNNVEIITFDEVLEKVKGFIDALAGQS